MSKESNRIKMSKESNLFYEYAELYKEYFSLRDKAWEAYLKAIKEGYEKYWHEGDDLMEMSRKLRFKIQCLIKKSYTKTKGPRSK